MGRLKLAVAMAILILYLAALAFAIAFTRRGAVPSLSNVTWAWVNLVPLRVVQTTYVQLVEHGNLTPLWLNFLGNIAVFVPIGFLLPVIKKGMPLKTALLISFAISLVIELYQLTLPRFSDIDDLILNTTGGLIGWWCHRKMLFIQSCKRKDASLCSERK